MSCGGAQQPEDQGAECRDLKQLGRVVDRRLVDEEFVAVVQPVKLGGEDDERDRGDRDQRRRWVLQPRGERQHEQDRDGIGRCERAPIATITFLDGFQPVGASGGVVAVGVSAAHAARVEPHADFRETKPARP